MRECASRRRWRCRRPAWRARSWALRGAADMVRRDPTVLAPGVSCCDVAVTERDPDPARLRSVAEQLATEAAQFVRARRAAVFNGGRAESGGGAVRSKSTRTDPVTVVDTDTERLLRERLA